MTIKRSKGNERFIALFNFAEEEKTAWIQEDGIYIDVISGEQKEGKAVNVSADGFCWLYAVEKG